MAAKAVGWGMIGTRGWADMILGPAVNAARGARLNAVLSSSPEGAERIAAQPFFDDRAAHAALVADVGAVRVLLAADRLPADVDVPEVADAVALLAKEGTVLEPDAAARLGRFLRSACRLRRALRPRRGERHAAELADTGYTVLENAFTEDYALALREETHKNHEGRGEDASFRATMLLERGRIWEEAVAHPWVLTLADHMLGRGNLIYQSDTIVKGPGLETHPGLHSDYAASMVEEPFPDFCLEATAVWAIDDFRGECGPTCIVPGSFKERRQVPPGVTQEGSVTIEMPPGCIAFWHGATWHGSTPRKAAGKRTSLHNAYSRNFMRPIERYEEIDQAIVDRNPPVFSTLCGLDDAFGKSGLMGADFERLGYAAKSGYGRSTAFGTALLDE